MLTAPRIAALAAALAVAAPLDAQPTPTPTRVPGRVVRPSAGVDAVPALGWTADEIRTLANTQFFEGVPYDLVRSFPPAVAQPVLVALLDDPRQEAAWPNAAAMLGMVGDASVTARLVDFASRADARVSPEATRAKSSAVLGLGYLAQRTASPVAIEWLARAASPGGARVRWTSAFAADAGARDRQVAEVATLALGLAAQPASRAALARVSRDRVGGDVVDEALRTDAVVSRGGLLRYYGLSDLPTLKLYRPGQLAPVVRRPAATAAVAPITFSRALGQVIAVPGPSSAVRVPAAGEILPQPARGTPQMIPNPVPR